MTDVEREVLDTLGSMKELNKMKSVTEQVNRVDQVVGKVGELKTLRCKYVI